MVKSDGAYKNNSINTDHLSSLSLLGGSEGPCIVLSSSLSPPKLVMNNNFPCLSGDLDLDFDDDDDLKSDHKNNDFFLVVQTNAFTNAVKPVLRGHLWDKEKVAF